MNLEVIISAIRNNRIRITDHAYEEAQTDNLSFDEIFNSIFNGEIIEQYPNDQPYPSCLIFSEISNQVPVHTVWGYNSENHWAVLITVYRPDPRFWINWRKRRPKDGAL